MADGLDLINKAEFGNHLCAFYQNRENLARLLGPYFRAGLNRGDFCLWIPSNLTSDQAIQELSAEIPNLDSFLGTGQMQIVSSEDWYLETGVFEYQRALEKMRAKFDEISVKGFRGITASGEVIWGNDIHWPDMKAYEDTMNEEIPHLNVNGLCSYQANHCGPNKVVDLMRNHQSTLVESNDRWDNISDSNQANERLLFQASLLDQVRDAVIAIDLQRRVIYWNKFAEVMYQWTAEEAIGKLIGDLIVPIHSREPREKIYKDLEHQGHWEGEFNVRRKDGTQFPAFTTNSEILDSHGRRFGFVGVSVDISERERNEEEKRRLILDLTIHQRQLEALSHRQVEIQEAEKRHIARELHDEIGQLLTGAKMKLEGIIQSSNAHDSLRLLETEDLIDEIVSRVQDLSLDLRPPILDSLGLLPAVEWHLHRVESQTDLSITFEHDQIEGKRFKTEIETAAFRTIQEALTNAIRYSQSACLRITVKAARSNLIVEIQDDGLGFDPEIIADAEKSIGLTGMRERAKLLGGSLNIDTAPGKGVTVVAVLPLEES